MKSIKLSLAGLILLSVTSALHAQTEIFVQDTIRTDSIWDVDVVNLTGDLLIAAGASLSISHGTLVEARGHYKIEVQGSLLAEGQPGDSIHFTITDNTGFSDTSNLDGAWQGILFRNTAAYDSSVLDICVIEYVKNKYSALPEEQGGAITLDRYTKIRISNCNIRNNIGYRAGAVLCLQDIIPLIKNNSICNNRALSVTYEEAGAGAICCVNSSPVISGNRIMYNSCDYYWGTTIYSKGGNPFIERNTIAYNDCGALEIRESIWNIRIMNNTMVNNDGRGVLVENTDVTIVNNLICNNNRGLQTQSSDALVLNNTIANNDGDGYRIVFGSPVIVNTIFDGNNGYAGHEVIIQAGTSPSFYNCLFENGGSDINGVIVDSANIIAAAPEFEDPSANYGPGFDALHKNWSLTDTSECVNNGDNMWVVNEDLAYDLNGNQRIIHGRADIGAFEKHILSDDASGTYAGNIRWIADTIYVTDDVYLMPTAYLSIAPGTVVMVEGYFKIEILGYIDARGTPDEPIVFTCRDRSGIEDFKTFLGGWKGFKITRDTGSAVIDTNVFSFCIIEYMRGDQSGTFYAHYSSLMELDHMIFRNNVVNDPGSWGTGTISLRESKARIDSCVFYNNYGNKYAGIWLYDSEIEMNQNTFHDNHAVYNAVLYASSSSVVNMDRNRIYNNLSDSGYLFQVESSQVNVKNSLFTNNESMKGGMLIASSSLSLLNSTIINNTILEDAWLSFTGLTESKLANSILWGNHISQSDDFQVHLLGENTSPEFMFCNIEGGLQGIETANGETFNGVFHSCMDMDPLFIDPTDQAGIDADAGNSDWRVISLSPVINAGDPDTDQNHPGLYDVYGQSRLMGERVDIGAVENQSGKPVITTHPQSAYLCEGDTLRLVASASDTVIYQWKKDGVPIGGQTETSLVIDSVSLRDQGIYSCQVSNSLGSSETGPASIFISVGPKILTELNQDYWIKGGENFRLNLSAYGSTPMYHQWYRNGKIISGAVYPEYQITTADSSDEGSYHCTIHNTCGSITSSDVNLYLAPQICMVTVSTTTGHNLVVWEKKSIAPILSYNIYRESVAAGIYDLLATVPYDDLSVFVDTTADPTVQAYIYKITAVLDTALNETDIDLCKPHKTVHLIVSTNPELNTTQLQWDRYYGFDYQTYTIYRSNAGVNFDPVHSLSASNNSWTDPDPSDSDLYYRIAVEKPVPCEPEGNGKKAGTGPYRHSLSNMDNNKLKAGEIPPDTITISKNTIEEENQAGVVIGKFLTEDGDSLDSHTYKFVPGEGDSNNISFTILGDLLLASESFDYETRSQYSIRIRSTDEAGNYCEVVFIIEIIDVDETTGLPVLASGAVRAFPNPFSESTTINFPNPAREEYRMVLTDLSGKVCRLEENISTSEYVLERKDLKSGLYFIELMGGKTFRGKIIVD